MARFKVIDGAKLEHQSKPREWHMMKYLDMANRHFNSFMESRDRYSLAAYCFCYVRFFNYSIDDNSEVTAVFEGASAGKNVMSLLTPREFLRTFPPDKSYDGEKMQCVDYFSSMKKFKDLPMDTPMDVSGADMLEIIYGYDNPDIMTFNVNSMMAVSRLHEAQTGKDLFDSFLESQGKPPLKKYYMHTDAKGKQYMVDEDGNSFAVKKPTPRYLRVVKE